MTIPGARKIDSFFPTSRIGDHRHVSVRIRPEARQQLRPSAERVFSRHAREKRRRDVHSRVSPAVARLVTDRVPTGCILNYHLDGVLG